MSAVTGTSGRTASAGKHEMLRAEGCSHPIDYRAVDYAAEVRLLTGGEGVDVGSGPAGRQ